MRTAGLPCLRLAVAGVLVLVGLGMGGSLGFVEEGVAQEEGARCSGVNGEGATRDGAPCGSGAVEAAGLAVEALSGPCMVHGNQHGLWFSCVRLVPIGL